MANSLKLKLGGSGRAKQVMGAAFVGGSLVLLAVVWLAMTQRVDPDEFAVRQVYLFSGQGVQEQVYGPGLHLVVPGYERLHVFPRDMQALELNDDELARVQANRQAARREDFKVAPAIRIQTSEGYQVTVDVSVLYRVSDPFAVVTKVGAGRIYESKVVARRADKILRQTLGRLDAEDFYNDQTRIHMAEQTRQLLTADLLEWGIQVWGVLVRDYTYDQRYQNAIEQRKIQDQTVFKNQAEAVAATREAEKNRVLAEGQARIEVELERGRSEVRKIAAEADSYSRQRVAAGELLVALAEAEGTQLENLALQQAGASNVVGLEMAKALEGTEVIVVSTTGADAVNPLDLNSLLRGW
jgi:regulator of protease activity HflC (stomatin/prohibitin superfamily)